MNESYDEKYGEKIFDSIRYYDEEQKIEFWYARDLQKVLDYSEWRNFLNVVRKAMESCNNSGQNVVDHFVRVNKMVPVGSGATREQDDMLLTRYACYLIVQNADPQKTVVASGQTYFAVSTRVVELEKEFDRLSEDKKRIAIRQELKNHNKSLAEAANLSGVVQPIDFAIFQNKGYQGLYNGLTSADIKKRKNLSQKDDILDHMGSTELAANLFRATQADDKLRREKIRDKVHANNVHYNVGKKVRETIRELGGEMPENLPTPEKSIKQVKKDIDNNLGDK